MAPLDGATAQGHQLLKRAGCDRGIRALIGFTFAARRRAPGPPPARGPPLFGTLQQAPPALPAGASTEAGREPARQAAARAGQWRGEAPAPGGAHLAQGAAVGPLDPQTPNWKGAPDGGNWPDHPPNTRRVQRDGRPCRADLQQLAIQRIRGLIGSATRPSVRGHSRLLGGLAELRATLAAGNFSRSRRCRVEDPGGPQAAEVEVNGAARLTRLVGRGHHRPARPSWLKHGPENAIDRKGLAEVPGIATSTKGCHPQAWPAS